MRKRFRIILLIAGILSLAPITSAAADIKPIIPFRADQQEACKASPTPIVIKVVGVRSDRGFITGQLHDDDPDSWLEGKKRIHRERWTAQTGETELCFETPGPGIYALAVYHDLNANRKLDTTWIGLPDEPWGLSNNPEAGLGPPGHEEAAFEVPEGGITIVVKLSDP